MKHGIKLGQGIYYAVISGTFAAVGSLIGKLTGSSEHIDYVCGAFYSLKSRTYDSEYDHANTCGYIVNWLVKAVMVVCMILFNTAGLACFVKALKASKSTLPATLISTSTSFILSAVLGALVFGETTSLIWWIGAIMVLLGLLLVSEERDVTKKDS